eukprot:TRINITY_DN11580_c0_g1_i4.p1 TRINITY_DN11580_c0_g1~~TRINITY_DN11580_c0_g1_i4.p1  ORF type:complete len:981 (+),score=223.55 TRINITY_DN11580_c0_g1_i4:200-3142(+)
MAERRPASPAPGQQGVAARRQASSPRRQASSPAPGHGVARRQASPSPGTGGARQAASTIGQASLAPADGGGQLSSTPADGGGQVFVKVQRAGGQDADPHPLHDITDTELEEIRQLKHPPEVCRRVMECVYLILLDGPLPMKLNEGIDWLLVLRTVVRTDFLKRVRRYDANQLKDKPTLVDHLCREYLGGDNALLTDRVERGSRVVVAFFGWTIALVSGALPHWPADEVGGEVARKKVQELEEARKMALQQKMIAEQKAREEAERQRAMWEAKEKARQEAEQKRIAKEQAAREAAAKIAEMRRAEARQAEEERRLKEETKLRLIREEERREAAERKRIAEEKAKLERLRKAVKEAARLLDEDSASDSDEEEPQETEQLAIWNVAGNPDRRLLNHDNGKLTLVGGAIFVSFCNVVTTESIRNGTHYFELVVHELSEDMWFGLTGEDTQAGARVAGTNLRAWSYYSGRGKAELTPRRRDGGCLVVNKKVEQQWTRLASGDVLRLAVDADRRCAAFSVNDHLQGAFVLPAERGQKIPLFLLVHLQTAGDVVQLKPLPPHEVPAQMQEALTVVALVDADYVRSRRAERSRRKAAHEAALRQLAEAEAEAAQAARVAAAGMASAVRAKAPDAAGDKAGTEDAPMQRVPLAAPQRSVEQTALPSDLKPRPDEKTTPDVGTAAETRASTATTASLGDEPRRPPSEPRRPLSEPRRPLSGIAKGEVSNGQTLTQPWPHALAADAAGGTDRLCYLAANAKTAVRPPSRSSVVGPPRSPPSLPSMLPTTPQSPSATSSGASPYHMASSARSRRSGYSGYGGDSLRACASLLLSPTSSGGYRSEAARASPKTFLPSASPVTPQRLPRAASTGGFVGRQGSGTGAKAASLVAPPAAGSVSQPPVAAPRPVSTPAVPQSTAAELVLPPEGWSAEDVSTFLRQIGLGMYAETFQQEGVDGSILCLDLNEDIAQNDLGMKALHVGKLFREIRKLTA